MVDNITGATGPTGPYPMRPQAGAAADARPGQTNTNAAAGAIREAPRDEASFMGIPAAELTPNVHRALSQSMGEVMQLRGENDRLKTRLRELENLADHDPLTPTLNRRAFMRELQKTVSYTDRYDTQASVAFFDMNNFKAINDANGHAAGDAALKQVADTLNANIRESDVVGRLGGDEFAVILASAGPDAARAKAQTLADAITATTLNMPDGTSIALSVSFGVQSFAKGGNAEAIIAAADAEMFIAKRVASKQ